MACLPSRHGCVAIAGMFLVLLPKQRSAPERVVIAIDWPDGAGRQPLAVHFAAWVVALGSYVRIFVHLSLLATNPLWVAILVGQFAKDLPTI